MPPPVVVSSTSFPEKKTLQTIIEFIKKNPVISGLVLDQRHFSEFFSAGGNMESLKLLLEESKLLYPEFLGSYRFIRQNKESIKEIRAHIAACAELGIPLISIYSDDRRNKKNVTEDESDLLRRGLREASHFAADHNIILAWDLTAGQVYDDMESAMKFLTKLYRKNIFYRMDTWHIFSEAKMDPVLFFHMFKDLVVSVRCRSRDASQDVSGPLAASSCNYPEFLKSLVKNNYRGHISVEWPGEDSETMIPQETEFIVKSLALHNIAMPPGEKT